MADQLGFASAFMDPRLGRNEKLGRIEAMIDWSALGRLLERERASAAGRPPYPALSMLKALYLQQLYELSDPGLEAALLDRLSFRRFCGFALEDRTPDETTICRFRTAAAESGALQACFEEIARQLSARGLILKKGTLLDASIVQAAHRPPPRAAGAGAAHPKEPGADWTRKDGKAHFGYKLHLAVDEGSGLVRRAILTPARVYESEVADELVCGDERAVYADRAYEKKQRRAALKARGVKDRIMHRRHKHMPVLPRWMQRRNQLIARRRAPVEAVFAAMKRVYGKGRARCLSLGRNLGDYLAFLSIYNLRRASLLTA